MIKDDPLTAAQYAKIQAVADACMMGRDGKPKLTDSAYIAYRDVITKTYASDDHKGMQVARSAMGERAYHAMRTALKDPAKLAHKLGIDPNDPRQVYAARQYLKAAVSTRPSHFQKENIEITYRNRLVGGWNGDDTITPKHKLLMLNDTAIPQRDEAKPHPVDVVLRNTHFAQVVQRSESKTWRPGVSDEPATHKEEIREPKREYLRELAISGVHDLYNNPYIQPVIVALAAHMRREKGTVIFSNHPNGVGDFVKTKYGASSGMFGGTGGVYVGHNSVISQALANPFDGQPSTDALATMIHEVQHMLFNKIGKNGSSPVQAGTPEETALDEALDKDIALRKGIDRASLPRKAREMYDALEGQLLEENSYFFGGFDPTNARHRHTLQTEAIVRPLQVLATGGTEGDIEAVAPNLWAFVKAHSLPLLEAYGKQAMNDGILGAATARQTPAITFKEEARVEVTTRDLKAPPGEQDASGAKQGMSTYVER